MLGFKLLPELISAILSIYVTLTTPPVNELSIQALGKCQPGVAEKQAINTRNGGPTR